MTKHTAPKDVLAKRGITTQHQWRKIKRAELAKALKALEVYRIGCAYCPDYLEIVDVIDVIESALKNMSVKQWGK